MASPEQSIVEPNLRYIGPRPRDVGFVLPLEEGWSAVDHFEGDAAVFARKVASGNYVPAAPATKKEAPDGDSTAEL